MEAIIRFLILRYGTDVLEWSVKQMLERYMADGGDRNGDGCVTPADRAIAAQRVGYDLDPDSGVYFWELPTREQ